VTIRSDQMDAVTYETGYYSMGHSSRFVNPGAYRIDSTNWSDDLETIAYLNQDNTIVVVISNRSNNRREVKVTWKSNEATFSMAGTSAATLKWTVF
jgi:glucosylceramidase